MAAILYGDGHGVEDVPALVEAVGGWRAASVGG